jgi:hypothetical protein
MTILLLGQGCRPIVYWKELKTTVRIMLMIMIMQVTTGNVKEKFFGFYKISSGSSLKIDL